MQVAYLIYVCYYYLFVTHLCCPWFLASQSCNFVLVFCKNFGLLSLFAYVYCLKIHRDLNVVSASTLWLTAWIDIVGSIGFIDLKNNSARVLMRLIICSFQTQV